MSTPETIQTMCPMNCHPTLCGMKVSVADGELISIEGDEQNPDSKGVLCMRGNAAHEIVGNEKRLLAPMIRNNPDSEAWRETDWESTLDHIASKMNEVGREAVGIWQGHGNMSNDYAFGLKRAQMDRFANLYGCQLWNPAMICWGLGGFGLSLTGALETSTKEDMSANSEMIILWGANSVSQANTIKHVMIAKERGARIVVIDVRRTEASALADDVFIIKPGSDAALALSMMHVIVEEGLVDEAFIRDHTTGFEALCEHLKSMTPDWVAERTGLTPKEIIEFARAYASVLPSMIVMGGSSMHKGANTWQAARAISCLPALTGKFGKAGGGIGPRHGGRSHGVGFNDISAADRRVPGNYIPNQMESIIEGMENGTVKVLIIIGSNFLSSFPDANRVKKALNKLDLVVAYDLFSNQTIRETAHIVLPGTIWLEELGGKSTNTHVYLCDKALPAAGEARPAYEVYKGLADRLGVDDVYPWADQEEAMNVVLDHPATGHASVQSLRENGGNAELKISHVAYPTLEFHTPSGQIEFYSNRAEDWGLSPLPIAHHVEVSDDHLMFTHGRTFTHFHSFFDHGQALPTLAARESEPHLWISPADAEKRNIEDGEAIEISNHRGTFSARAKVTPKINQGVVWMRDGWPGLNALTNVSAILPEATLDQFPFSVGQSEFGAVVQVTKAG